MSDITLPNPTFTDGNTLVADDVWENFYTAEAVPNSLEVINGGLEEPNLLSPTISSITSQMLQTGSMSSGGGVGATANVDYFPEPFSDWTDDPTKDLDSYFQAIPGASIEFFLPYAVSVLVLTWQLTTHIENNNPSGTEFLGKFRLFMDGARVSDNVFCDLPAKLGEQFRPDFGRPWSGHYMKIGGLSKGWHSASIRVAADKASANQVRVLTRNMNYVYFQ